MILTKIEKNKRVRQIVGLIGTAKKLIFLLFSFVLPLCASLILSAVLGRLYGNDMGWAFAGLLDHVHQ